jgi:RNA polymerase sigma-70 factor (ECF subfamily)
MERHHGRLYRIALSYLRDADEALDAVQETFVKAYRNVSRWDPDSEVTPWLTRIAVNHCIDVYRRRRRIVTDPEPQGGSDHDDRATASEPSPERRVLSRELAERISRALRGLPEQQRAVFVLRHYEGLTLQEIAASMDISLGTVKSTLHRAIHRLRERLEGLRA